MSFVTDVAASSLPVTGLLRFVLTVERHRSICWTTSPLPRLPRTGRPARFLRRDPQVVEWKTAIRCAALVAIVAAALSVAGTRFPVVSALSSLWIISGSLITVGLYQWRRPLALMDAGVGARIGLVAGLALITCLGVSMAVAGLVARFGLHSMAAFDAQLTEQLHTQIEKAAAANPAPPEVIRFMYTPEFRAGIMLAGFAMVAGALLLLSALGGAVGGMLRTRRPASV